MKTRIRHDGDVLAYGRKPESNLIGWWYCGQREEIAAEIRREEESKP